MGLKSAECLQACSPAENTVVEQVTELLFRGTMSQG